MVYKRRTDSFEARLFAELNKESQDTPQRASETYERAVSETRYKVATDMRPIKPCSTADLNERKTRTQQHHHTILEFSPRSFYRSQYIVYCIMQAFLGIDLVRERMPKVQQVDTKLVKWDDISQHKTNVAPIEGVTIWHLRSCPTLLAHQGRCIRWISPV